MIEINGTTFTNGPGEADEVFKMLKAAGYDPAPLPVCKHGINDDGCGRLTGYIVEECIVKEWEDGKKSIRPKRIGVAMLMGVVQQLDYAYHEKKLYFRIPVCHKCGAARDGWYAGYSRPVNRPIDLKRIETAALLPEEIAEYKQVYDRSFDKAAAQAQEKATKKRGKKSRYKEK